MYNVCFQAISYINIVFRPNSDFQEIWTLSNWYELFLFLSSNVFWQDKVIECFLLQKKTCLPESWSLNKYNKSCVQPKLLFQRTIYLIYNTCSAPIIFLFFFFEEKRKKISGKKTTALQQKNHINQTTHLHSIHT